MTRIKTLFALGVLLAPPTIVARTLNVDEAKQNAEAFISKITAKGTASVPTLNDATPISRSAHPPYYIFNVDDNQGYIIASADDRFHEILGYADKGSYRADGSNPAFEWWLNAISEEMAKAPAISTSSSRATVEMPDIEPLIKTTWGQDEPYNRHCPLYIADQPYAKTGDVATAMAQIINYYQWPSSYNSYEYKWDLMLPSYTGSESNDAIEQVARLMRNCGDALDSEYTPVGTEQSFGNTADALINSFHYDDSTLKLLWRNSYGLEEIQSVLSNELKEGRPILAVGSFTFIIDGCNSDGLFHINWGYDGIYDGYLRLDPLKRGSYYMNNMQYLIGIRPKQNDSPSALLGTFTGLGDIAIKNESADTVYYPYKDSVSFEVTTINHVYEDKNFGFMNFGAGRVTHVGTRLTNLSTGDEVVELSEAEYKMWTGIYSIGITHGNLEENTTYRSNLVYKSENSDEVFDFKYSIGRRGYLLLNRIGDKVEVTLPDVGTNLTVCLREQRFPTYYHQPLNIVFHNNASEEYIGECTFKIFDSDNNVVYNTYLSLDLLPDAEYEETGYFNFLDYVPGTYKVGIYDFRNKLIGELLDFEIYDISAKIDKATFPDAALRNYLSENFDSDRNGILSPVEIDSIHTFNLNNVGVTDLTGIEHLWYLMYIHIENEKITTLDLSSKERLYQLEIRDTPVEILKLPEDTDESPMTLQIVGTRIKELDLTFCKNLDYLTIANTPLEKFQLGDHSDMLQILIESTAVQTLDLSGCTGLKDIQIHNNKSLKSINAKGLSNLEVLSCTYNVLETLDISGADNLIELSAYVNKISAFKYSQHSKLRILDVSSNDISGRIDLNCFPAVETVRCDNNKLEELLIGNNTQLETINFYRNLISGTLDLSGCTALKTVSGGENRLDKLVMGDNKALENIYLSYNAIKGVVDLSNLKSLKEANIWGNSVQEIKIGNNPSLTKLSIGSNKIEGVLDLNSTPELEYLNAADNKIIGLVYPIKNNLKYLDISYNSLTYFHAEDFRDIELNYRSQHPALTIERSYIDLTELKATGFDPSRASGWRACGLYSWLPCSIENDKVILPDGIDEELMLVLYEYVVDPTAAAPETYSLTLKYNEFNSIDKILADDSIRMEGRTIIFLADGINEIYTISGTKIYSGENPTFTVENSGIYIVRCAGRSFKVAIR